MSRTKAEVREELDNLELERRSFLEEVRHGTGDFNKDEADKKLKSFEERRANLEKEFAECERPVETGEKALKLTNRDFIEAAEQKRAITIGGTGKVNQVKTLFEGIGEKSDILDEITFEFGDNAQTNYTILEPGLDEPEDLDEGGTLTADSHASMTTNEVAVRGESILLPITAEALKLGTVDIQSKLPEIFQKAYRKKMHKKLLQGTLTPETGKGTKGIWTSAAANTEGITSLASSQTSLKISDVVGLALKVNDFDEKFEIVMNSATYQKLIADSTEGEDIKLYKKGLIENKEIETVKVRLDAKAPKATAAGSILAVAVPLSRFHMCVSGSMEITPIKVPNDTKTYFQAEYFTGGKQVTDKDIYSLAVHS